MDITLHETAEFLKGKDNFLILSHSSPDADTIGSAVALVVGLRSLGRNAVAICDEKMPKKLAFLDTESCFVDTEPMGIQTYISVDTASAIMLGGLMDKYTVNRRFDLSIDHHMVNSIPCERRLLLSNYSSCGEIIFELLKELDVQINQFTALPLYGAMSSDSGGFRYSSTRPDTLRIAAELMETGIDFAKINRLLFDSKTPTQIEIERIAYNSIEMFYGGKLAVVTITNDDLAKLNSDERDIDSVNQIPRQIDGVEVSAVIRPKGDKVKVSLRSNEYFNVAQFASENFGGGGHHHAAGCSFDKDIKEVKKIIITSLEGKF
ncbi:MAG: hypothetical protein A2Y15_00365 [Clostridiales bacterium GWF2_36_10]|nr:MAG: hypothetical protein A2Y15_00365 [Clostridiales bacterium GWF2_36_10]